MASPAKPAWAVEPAGHVEAMLVLGDAPGEQRFRLDVPGKAAYKLGRLAEQCDIHVQARTPRLPVLLRAVWHVVAPCAPPRTWSRRALRRAAARRGR